MIDALKKEIINISKHKDVFTVRDVFEEVELDVNIPQVWRALRLLVQEERIYRVKHGHYSAAV